MCSNANGIIHIIELKRPNITISSEELSQITEYVEFFKTQFPDSVDKVYGYLISDNMKLKPGVETLKSALVSQNIYVKSYSDLLNEARAYNNHLLKHMTKFKK
ncbi:hypothetical protein [Clostridium beijerinckii]|uniref:hypothetical protein n=1 Tax=Clostridium beijerinckii TaxID=1520 RepID=UPI00156EE61B|nr:hypothetical protein [Clostridium beijerinckii]NRT75515.1 RecB family endonuclease NucS [Clostridium beijerinckii]